MNEPALKETTVPPKQRIRRRKGVPQLRVIHGTKELERDDGKELLLSLSHRIAAKQRQRPVRRLPDAPELRSIAVAMDAVEARLVKAFWVLHRSQRDPSPRAPGQHGVGYMLEREDKWAAAVAGGGWLSSEPAPPPARAHEISEADEALEWLGLIERESIRRLVAVVAMAKRGDPHRRTPWPRLRTKLGSMSADPQRTLQWRYREGLRIIVGELMLATVAPQA